MKKLFILIYYVTNLGLGYSQEYCGIRNLTSDEHSSLPWVGDERWLQSVLNERGYNIPKNYFRTVDEIGFYAGQKWKFFHLNEGRLENDLNFQLMQLSPGTIIYPSEYYIPVKVWIHKGLDGQIPLTLDEIAGRFSDTNEIYSANGVPINFFFDCDLVEEVDNSPHYYMESENEEFGLYHDYNEPDHFDLHIVGFANSNGSADGTPSSNCWIISTSENIL